MKIKDLLNKLLYKYNFSFYLNDKLIDLDILLSYDYEVDNFEVDGNAFRIGSSECYNENI